MAGVGGPTKGDARALSAARDAVFAAQRDHVCLHGRCGNGRGAARVRQDDCEFVRPGEPFRGGVERGADCQPLRGAASHRRSTGRRLSRDWAEGESCERRRGRNDRICDGAMAVGGHAARRSDLGECAGCRGQREYLRLALCGDGSGDEDDPRGGFCADRYLGAQEPAGI